MTAYPLAGAARYWTRRAFRPRIPLVVLTAVLIGASVAYSSALVFVAAVGVLALTVFIKAPSWMLVVLVVASFAGADVTRLELVANGVPVSAAGVLGLGRLSLALAALALARAVLQQDVPRIPRGVLVAVGTYLVSILLQVQIALIRGTGSPAILSDLQRETAVVAAFVVGVIVVHSAKRRLALYRGLAAVGLVCSLGALWYWGWASEVIGPPPFMGEIFVHARERAIDHGGAVDRARFPFVLTHPNLCGFVLASMAVFATPPLLQSPQLRDRLFALLVAVVTAGGVLGTQSRTALLALAAGAVAYLLLTRAISPRMRALAFAAIVLLGIGVWALLDLLPDRRTFTDLSTLESRQASGQTPWR